MLHGTDGNGHEAVLFFPYRDVLLDGSIRGAGDDLFHGLAAAHDRAGFLLDHFDDLAAGGAAIELDFHDILLFRRAGPDRFPDPVTRCFHLLSYLFPRRM